MQLTKEYLSNASLSFLLRMAVVDFRKVLRTPGLEPNMYVFVSEIRGTCHVCLAGSCLYFRFGERGRRPFDRLPTFASRIDDMRMGALPRWRHIPDFVRVKFQIIVNSDFSFERDGGRATLATYLRAATYLESQGL